MTTAAIKTLRKPAKLRKSLIQRMEKAAPSGDRLARLVKKHPAPQKWYDEDHPSSKRSK